MNAQQYTTSPADPFALMRTVAFDLSGPFSMPVMAALITAMTCGLAAAYALAWRLGQASDARISSRGPESRSRRRR